MLTATELSYLMLSLGVTRIARITGLDRCGVEVACAVRPGGHVLQVCNGKGDTFAQAAAGALMETAELWAAERVDESRLRWGSLEELRGSGQRPRLAGQRPRESGQRPRELGQRPRELGQRPRELGQRPGQLGQRPRRGAEDASARGATERSARGATERNMIAWGADELGSAGPLAAPRLWSAQMRCAWLPAIDLHDGGEVLVPAQAAHCPPPGSPPLGPAVIRWSSNGSGAHPRREAALLHALLEACERDQLARALPQGFTEAAVRRRLLDPRSLSAAAPRTAARAEALRAAGFEVHLFDLAPAGARGLGLPVAGALLADREGGSQPLTAGYACRPGRDEALSAALLEAAQSRLTDVHGARDDVQPADPHAAAGLLTACARARPSRRVTQMSDEDGGVPLLLARLRRAGHARAAVVELSPRSLGAHVLKVIVPGLRVSELL